MNRNYRVIRNYIKSSANPIKLHAGDRVKCMQESDPSGDWPNWILCSSDTSEGWIPAQIIERSGDEGTILEDYDASEFDLEEGETVVMERELNGWIWGYKSENHECTAWAPLNCLKQCPAVEYRDMAREDVKETLKVARKAFPFWYRLFIWNFKKAVVAIEEGKITGGAARHEIKTRKGLFGYIDFGFTAKESRGKGIGRETYSRTLAALEKDGCKRSGAIVLCDNTASWGLLADNGCTRSSASELIREFGFTGTLKIWFESAFLFAPGSELWITGEYGKKKKSQAADIAAFLLINPVIAFLHSIILRGTPDPVNSGFVFCLMLLTLIFSWLPLRLSGLPVKFIFWKSGPIIPVFVFLSGGVYPFGGGFYPTDEKWNYRDVRKQLGLSGLGGWLAAITGGVFLLVIKYFAPQLHISFQSSFNWIFILLIFNSLPILLESWHGSRVIKWNKVVFYILLGISALWLFLTF